MLGVIAVAMPNSNRLGEALHALVGRNAVARHLVLGFALTACLFLVLLNSARDSISAFIYFNF
jgi:alginate O-acetyltransferase complex protein AlgI